MASSPVDGGRLDAYVNSDSKRTSLVRKNFGRGWFMTACFEYEIAKDNQIIVVRGNSFMKLSDAKQCKHYALVNTKITI